MPITDLQFHHQFRSGSRAKTYVGSVSVDLAPVAAERVLAIDLEGGRVELFAAEGKLYEAWSGTGGALAGEPADSLPVSEHDAFESMRKIRASQWSELRLRGDTILRPVARNACFSFSTVEGGTAALNWRETGPADGDIALPLSVVAEFAYLDPAADLEFVDHAALVRLDHAAGTPPGGPGTPRGIENHGFVDATLRTMSRGVGSADPATIRWYAEAVDARVRVLTDATAADEVDMWVALRQAILGMRGIGQPDGVAPAPHAERFHRTVGAEMRSMVPLAPLAEAGLAARLPDHPLTLLRRLHDETADWENALAGGRPSLVRARRYAAGLLAALPIDSEMLVDPATGESVEEALDALGREASDWAQALSGERPSLDAILAQVAGPSRASPRLG